jgi:hypothetical protein
MMIPPSVKRYYSRKDVQKAIAEVAKDREIAGEYYNGKFDKRPNIIEYPDDIAELVKKGIIGFHGSVERWSNPMRLDTGLLKDELDNLRIGWDLVVDPDCPDFEVSKVTTKVVIDALKDHGMKNIGLKYTGGKSFHIGIPFEALPKKVNGKKTEKIFQEIGKGILEYLKNYIKDDLKDSLLILDNPMGLAERVNKSVTEISDKDGLDPFKIIEIDSMVASSRHMFRLPYSVNVKSLLVSMPLEPKDLAKFEKEDARPWKVKTDLKFFKEPKIAEGSMLVVEAMDWIGKTKRKERKDRVYKGPRARLKEIPKDYFPPSIKKILSGGLQDGRKRSVFILINFLRNMGWDWEKITDELKEWNEKNKPPLAINYIRTQLRWHQRRKENILPPNYDNNVFYISIGIIPTEEELNLKNPVNFVLVKLKGAKKRKK